MYTPADSWERLILQWSARQRTFFGAASSPSGAAGSAGAGTHQAVDKKPPQRLDRGSGLHSVRSSSFDQKLVFSR